MPSRPPITKLVAFSLIATTLVLFVAEGICRVSGLPREPNRMVMRVGFDGCFFRSMDDGQVELCEPGTDPDTRIRFAPHKAQQRVCRVAFVGGSSVRIPVSQYPQWPELIGQGTPHIEAINLGVPGANSAVTTMRALEALNYDVDVIVTYTGHNDAAQGVFMGGDRARLASLRAIRIRLLLNRSALYRFLVSRIMPLEPATRLGETRLEERTEMLFPPNDQEELARILKDNLTSLIRSAAPRPVIALVPVSNPQWNPTGTLVPLDADDARRLRDTLEQVRVSIKTGNLSQAQTLLDDTLALSPDSAYAWWLQSQLHARAGAAEEAAEAERRSRALDALPMRAFPSVEQATLDVPAFSVVDLPALLDRRGGLLDSEYFVDSIHFSEAGHQRVAELVMPEVRRACAKMGYR